MQNRTPICYHNKVREATKDSPALYRFEARMTGGNVLFATDIQKEEYPDMVRQVQENPQPFGF